ncbi:ATP-binding cassette domain-containing protein [Dysosmobacter welbionis]|uniref:ATP-binding cassette domain-containing protein n=1 Tax=Dysosmobacter welbionis TaxID=2093857 RepID=UPI003D720E51
MTAPARRSARPERDVTVNGCLKKPEVVAFAGPNGSGKSTITNLLRPTTAE